MCVRPAGSFPFCGTLVHSCLSVPGASIPGEAPSHLSTQWRNDNAAFGLVKHSLIIWCSARVNDLLWAALVCHTGCHQVCHARLTLSTLFLSCHISSTTQVGYQDDFAVLLQGEDRVAPQLYLRCDLHNNPHRRCKSLSLLLWK